MKHYLWQMRPYFRQVAGQLVLGSIMGIVMNTAVVLPAILLGRAIDAALALERGQATSGAVTWAALLFVGGTLLTEGPRIVKRWWLMTANARIRANLRADALRGVFAWPIERLHRTPIGDVMARTIGDVEVLGVGVREFTIETWDTLLFSLSLIVAMLVYDVNLTMVALLPAPVALLLAKLSGRWVVRRTTVAREANSSLTATLQEQLAGIRVLRLFGRGDAAAERVVSLSRRQANANLAMARLRYGLQPLYVALLFSGVALVVWQGSERVIGGAMTVGAFVAYLELYLRFTNRAYRIPQMVNSIQGGGAAYLRLRPLLAPPLPVKGEPPFASLRTGHVAGIGVPVPQPLVAPAGPASVSLRHVTFKYPGSASPTLQDVTFDIPAGALVAVTGPVGSGKSALAQVLLGLYPLESGTILLDGRPLEDITSAERAARIGYSPQDPYLFSGSVRENVLLPFPTIQANPDGHMLGKAIAIAALEEDLGTFPAHLETEIGEMGIRVSGGQRQRMALARAIAAPTPAQPGLLVLDDPFSAVDVDTEAKIITALREAFGPLAPPAQRATILLCSHRLGVFPQADLVIVLDGGRVVEQGTHVQLLRTGGLYARIYRAQRQVQLGARRKEQIP